MPLKIQKRCKVCQLIEGGDASLLKRIYASSKFKVGGEPLLRIHEDYEGKFTYSSLSTHCTIHQYVSESDLKRSTLHKMNQAEANKAVLAVIKQDNVRELVMERGYKGIKSGKIKLKAADVLKAAKDQDDKEFKKKDQGLQMMEMMFRFSSGEMQPAAAGTGADHSEAIEAD